MEADSTTYDGNFKPGTVETFPFPIKSGNLQLYIELTSNNREKSLESQIVERLQSFGLLPKALKCPSEKPECLLTYKSARVIDRIQWVCEGCGKRLPIRTGSFFLRLQCSLLQALQMILAWCEDAVCMNAAEYFGVKPRVATLIFDKLDELAVKEHSKHLLGGEGSVVLAEMYPDCLNRLSPDTTDQPHIHRILMLADTNHIPTSYKLHVIREDLKKQQFGAMESEWLGACVEQAARASVLGAGALVAGAHVPHVPGAHAAHRLLRSADPDMQHFLSTRIWRQAVILCSAARDLCSDNPSACAATVQRYLDTALYRRRFPQHFYRTILQAIADNYTDY